jgi:hypothetical protein
MKDNEYKAYSSIITYQNAELMLVCGVVARLKLEATFFVSKDTLRKNIWDLGLERFITVWKAIIHRQ